MFVTTFNVEEFKRQFKATAALFFTHPPYSDEAVMMVLRAYTIGQLRLLTIDKRHDEYTLMRDALAPVFDSIAGVDNSWRWWT